MKPTFNKKIVPWVTQIWLLTSHSSAATTCVTTRLNLAFWWKAAIFVIEEN
jgi:hypothetical protein